MALIESFLWIIVINTFLVSGFFLHEHFQKETRSVIEEFEREWNKIEI